MAIHSSILAWEIPWTEEPDRLQSMESQSRTRLKKLSAAPTALRIQSLPQGIYLTTKIPIKQGEHY